MTVSDAISRGYRIEKIGRAWLLTYRKQPLAATFRPAAVLATVEVHAMVTDTLRHGMRRA